MRQKKSISPSTRIRLLYVVDQLMVGGAEKQLLEMCRRLDRERFELFLFCTVEGGHLQSAFEALGVVVYIGKARFRFDVSSAVQLARFIARQRIDIVHSWLWYSNVICYLATRLTHRPRWLAAVHGIHINFGPMHRLVERWVLLAAIQVTTISQYNRDILIDKQRISTEKIVVIYNGIDVGLTENVKTDAQIESIGDRGPVIGCVANFGQEKGHFFLIQAMKLLVERVPEIQLVLVGDGPLRSEVESAIKKAKLENNIHLLGRRDDVPSVLAGLHLMVLPSTLEGMPIAILEAMAAHLPVVATRVGGIPELVLDGETGYLVEPGEPHQLVEAIIRLVEQPALRKTMGYKGWHRVLKEFSIERSVDAYDSLYTSL